MFKVYLQHLVFRYKNINLFVFKVYIHNIICFFPMDQVFQTIVTVNLHLSKFSTYIQYAINTCKPCVFQMWRQSYIRIYMHNCLLEILPYVCANAQIMHTQCTYVLQI